MIYKVRKADSHDIPQIKYLNNKFLLEKYDFDLLQRHFEFCGDFNYVCYIDNKDRISKNKQLPANNRHSTLEYKYSHSNGNSLELDEIRSNELINDMKQHQVTRIIEDYTCQNFIERQNEQIVGYILIDKTTNLLISICIDEEHRNKGIATFLINSYFKSVSYMVLNKDIAKKPFLNLCVRPSNTPALNFYIKKFEGQIQTIIPDYFEDGESAAYMIIQNKE